ncbi:MAG: DinB family protein [Acidobacteriales bacterium]|nr:DinB family protein [Terriglobales bacterium]
MGMSDGMLPEFDQEMAGARKTLERVPHGKFAWKPHEKSMTMGRLAQHLTELADWAVQTIEKDEIDIAPVGAPPYEPPKVESTKDLLAIFDKNAAAARAALQKASDAQWMRPWSLKAGGNNLFTMPKIAVYRAFVMNHLIHHRAQLGVYLRLNDVPVPSLYGPSADEGKM